MNLYEKALAEITEGVRLALIEVNKNVKPEDRNAALNAIQETAARKYQLLKKKVR